MPTQSPTPIAFNTFRENLQLKDLPQKFYQQHFDQLESAFNTLMKDIDEDGQKRLTRNLVILLKMLSDLASHDYYRPEFTQSLRLKFNEPAPLLVKSVHELVLTCVKSSEAEESKCPHELSVNDNIRGSLVDMLKELSKESELGVDIDKSAYVQTLKYYRDKSVTKSELACALSLVTLSTLLILMMMTGMVFPPAYAVLLGISMVALTAIGVGAMHYMNSAPERDEYKINKVCQQHKKLTLATKFCRFFKENESSCEKLNDIFNPPSLEVKPISPEKNAVGGAQIAAVVVAETGFMLAGEITVGLASGCIMM